MAELNFSVSDRLVIDGKDLVIDMATDWNSVALTTAIGVEKDEKKVRPFKDDDTFLGILSAKNIKSDVDVAGVNTIEVASLVDGYFYWVINGGENVVFGDKVKVTKNGFEKTDADADAVATVIIGGAQGEAIKIRGGK